MSPTLNSISDVVAYQLCTGCGVCAYIEPDVFSMFDTLEHGRRPIREKSLTVPESGEALSACPGVALARPAGLCRQIGLDQELLDGWGPVYGVWEGYAADSEIRYAGSSGGAATALALFCIEQENFSGVLHTAAHHLIPYLNKTVMSTCRSELLDRTGSRYAPASPAEGLDRVENAESKCVFIGKPCEAAAVQNARSMRPKLDSKVGVVIAFFCAGVPSLKGNLDLLKANGIPEPSLIGGLRYRGNGWPGMWTASIRSESGICDVRTMSYADSWAYLQRYRQWRCYICPDHSGEFADIAVGDPWYREVQAGEAGKSLIVARTLRGLQLVRAAASKGYIVLESEDKSLLPRSQPGFLESRANLWARLIVLRLLGAAVPRYRNFACFRYWLVELTLREKLQSFYSTVKRVFSKRLRIPIAVRTWSSGERP
jgi:coenzyme F420 hydrogenase subunit beta